MAEPDLAALAARAIQIAEQASGTQAAIVSQQARAKRTVRALFISVALDLALSVAMVTLAVSQAHVSGQIHKSQVSGCRIGNDFRAGQIQLWDHVIAVSKPPPHETAAQRKVRLATLAQFRAYIRHQFKPVDCARLYSQP